MGRRWARVNSIANSRDKAFNRREVSANLISHKKPCGGSHQYTRPYIAKQLEGSSRRPRPRPLVRGRHSLRLTNGRFAAGSNVPQIQSDLGDLRWQMDGSPLNDRLLLALWRGVPGQIWRRERGVRFSSETTVPGRGAEENIAVQKALTSAPSRYVVQADPALRYCAFRFFI